ncbi:AraC family transcriptional regulator [Halomonas denitrificans]|uniref:AraC family transcriptional regulator n=1 Tax=Halomonas TaxID=2745 RepID=UPI001A8F1873|nr:MULTISPECIES: AraC family transcriptional regulator [Halomonas]MBN8413657.1 helix-turn-helix domain-containing protein [Halomonas litopenaei]MBY5926249.1 AraC family transcriptional regulator [Halomonas sp. DP4Y7-2]MBY5931288.1 AraC family transcriptional regulator [Halomonas sp. DP8Y7-3]MBY5984813.1 AraC family transcriptional regulator [Halomonas sp. DP5Y7-2]MBY6030892.1 AraC family transcriptional regulator [Halomonas sp. DP8Y7-1]
MSSAIRRIPLDTATQHHSHDYHQIVIALAGRADFDIEGLGGTIEPFCGCIVPANHLHYYAGTGNNRQLIVDLPHDALALTGHHHELSRLFDAPRFFTLDAPLRRYLDFLVAELDHLAEEGPVPALHQERLATTFLGSLHARLAADCGTNAQHRRIDLRALDRYIDDHLARRFKVADLAAFACLSETHFTERFRAQTGLSPWQYVMRRRLQASQRLLLRSRLPLSEIAALTGFAHQSALSRAYRKHFGHPPSQARRHLSGAAALNHAHLSANTAQPAKTAQQG